MSDAREMWPFDWTPPGPTPPAAPDLSAHMEAWVQMASQMTAAFRAVAEAMAPAVSMLRELHEQLIESGVLPEPIPADPRERALYLRRTHATGPPPQPLGRR